MTTTTPSKNNKWIWIGLGAAALFCLCAVGAAVLIFMRIGQQVKEGVKTNPQEASAAGHAIADYELPDGYQEMFAMDLMLYTTVMIAPDTTDAPASKPVIMLAQFQSMGNQQQMEQQIRQSFEQQSGSRGMNMQVVDVKKMEIRGQEVDVTTLEGTDDRGITIREVIATFPGKDGIAMLMIFGTAEDWDVDEIDAFIESIH